MAEKAGPAGRVVDQALAANVSAAASAAGTFTPPTRMSKRMTSPMASTAMMDARITSAIAAGLE